MSVAEMIGVQTPRVSSWPEYVSSAGEETIELAASAGLVLDPWQCFVLDHALGERPDGRWSAFEVGLVVSRQNGKGSLLEARALAGLFLFDERLIAWTAHQFDTSLEAYRRLRELIEGSDDFSRRVKRFANSHGEEGIELHGPPGRVISGGQRIRFRTRTKGGGRGFSGDCVIFDEAMILPESTVGALMPTVSARPNPQLWYTGSAPDQLKDDDCTVFARVRSRGIAGDPSLAFFEWSVDRDNPDDVDRATAESVESWAQANPSLGIRITLDYLANEQRSLDPRTHAVERLAVGDWPNPDPDSDAVVDLAVWDSLADCDSQLEGEMRFAIDVRPDRSRASIAAVGRRADGRFHLEVIDRREGTAWLPERCSELDAKWHPVAWHADERGPVASVLPSIADAGVDVETMGTSDVAMAAGFFADCVAEFDARHVSQPELRMAIRGAARRPLGDAWAFSRRSSTVDISPLVAVTLALWGWGREANRTGGIYLV